MYKINGQKKVFGEGYHFVRFVFKDTFKVTKEQPVKEVIACVVIRGKSRKDIAKIIRNYHRAEIYVRNNTDDNNFPQYGYRYIAKRKPSVDIFTSESKEFERMKMSKRFFCYEIKGYVSERKMFKAKFYHDFEEVTYNEFRSNNGENADIHSERETE